MEQNVTPLYDEGVFTINWTSGGGDAAANYTVYLWMDDSFVSSTLNANTSTVGYDFSNITEANYTFSISAVNATGDESTNSSNVSMYVDATGPIVNFTGYTNATFKRNTDNLILNISVGDALSGVTGSNCFIDVNGTNETVTVSSGWCNTTQLNLTGLADGNQTIKVYANDTVNVIGSNESFFVVQIDTTGPTPTASCGSNTIYLGDSFPCTCTGTDSGSGVSTNVGSSTAPEGITTISTIGSFTYTCTVTDIAGNSASSTKVYTVFNTGGGGAPVGPLKETHSFTKITPGAAAIVKNFDSEIGIKEIKIEVNNEAQNVKIVVTKYDGRPAEVSVTKSGKVDQYLQIEVSNVDNKLDKATITARVKKSWVSSNGLEIDDVAIFKFDENAEEWNELTTISREGDSTYYYYDAEVSSFSFFAIGEKVVVTDEGEEVGVSDERTTKKSTNLTWLWILIVVLILIAIGWNKKARKE